jgi:MFS family permease
LGAWRQYLDVWRMSGGPTLLIVGIVARLGIGITPLALLVLIERATGRYAVAGLAVGAYALAGAVFSPVAGRFADRIGPTPVLLVTAIAHPFALAGLLVAGRNSLPLMFVTSALAGSTYPPLTAAIRGAWTDATTPGTGRQQLRIVALAAETSLFELVFVLGPLLVGGFMVLTHSPDAALLFAALATGCGTAWVALSPLVSAWRRRDPGDRTRGLGPLRVPGFAALMCCVAGLGTAFGAASVAIPAYAAAGGAGDGVAGVLLGVWGVGSVVGGIWFGTWRITTALARQYAVLLAAVSVSLLVLVVMPSAFAIGIALTVGGATIAPTLTVENSLVGRIAPGGMLNEAYTWIVTVSVGGSAAGGAIGGVIVDRPGGVPWCFVAAGGVGPLTAGLAALPGGSLARADARARSAPQAEQP